jgi:hypothetical protein
MTLMSELVPAYQREVAPLGTFAAQYPSATTPLQIGLLSDAFAEAQLDGFFPTSVLDPDANEVDPDLSSAGRALVVIYAGIRTLRNDLGNAKSRVNYVAGPVQYEVEQAASVLKGLLDGALERRLALILSARQGKGTSVYAGDAYATRQIQGPWGLGWLPSEIGEIGPS